jgi:hypothetical protein
VNTASKLAAYGAAVVLVAAGAWAVGSAVGPLSAATPEPPPHAAEGAHGGGEAHGAGEHALVGLAGSANGYSISSPMVGVDGGNFRYTITGPDGKAVTAFEDSHDRRMHLVVVRRDLVEYQHLHPEMAPDGTWKIPLSVGRAGVYRAFADFVPEGGERQTLGIDLFADGAFQRVEHADSTQDTVDDYQVSLRGEFPDLTATITRGGVPVTDLEPYLGAYGHLVVLRKGDLPYVHAHPNGTPGDGTTTAGPDIGFGVEIPSAGTYRLFLDFQHEGTVRTAEFTMTAGDDHGHG